MLAPALAVLLAASASAAPAPDFKVAKVLNAPVSEIKSLESLKGKVVFLEFWATWCGPCVAGMPRTNRLIDALKGEPVVFLAVTDEKPETIQAFLKTHEVKAWIGVDEARTAFKAYKEPPRPSGFLIGKDGRLLARMSPDSLQEGDVRAALAGRFAPRPVKIGDAAAPPRASAANGGKNLFELVIAPASGEPSMSRGRDMIEGGGLPFARLIAWIWDVKDEQVIAEKPPVDSFNFRLKTSPDAFDKGLDALKLAVQAAFGVSVEPELAETDVLLLSLSPEPGAPRPQAGDPSLKRGIMRAASGRLLGKAPMPVFAKMLGMISPKPILDDTGLAGEFALDLEWKPGDDASRDRALAAQGLRLVPGRRKVELLRVAPAGKK